MSTPTVYRGSLHYQCLVITLDNYFEAVDNHDLLQVAEIERLLINLGYNFPKQWPLDLEPIEHFERCNPTFFNVVNSNWEQ